MSHDNDSQKKYEIAIHALVPLVTMLFVQMLLNYTTAPANMIFISPYLLAFWVAVVISIFVLWKGQICPGQASRLLFVFKFFLIFAVGNLAYSLAFTPKHIPMAMVSIAAILISLIYWNISNTERLANAVAYGCFAICGLAIVQYLVIYWVEIPSLFNGIRANNFAQLLLGILLAGWYLMLAKSRLDGFFKLLVQLALLMLILNYVWVAFVLYQQLQMMPEISLVPYLIYFGIQFVIFAILAWLLLGKGDKQIKNPLGWSAALALAMLYPFTNI